MTTARVIHEARSTQRWPHGMRVLLYLHRRLTWIAMEALVGVLRPAGGPRTARLAAMLSGLARRASPVAHGRLPQPALVEVASGSSRPTQAS